MRAISVGDVFYLRSPFKSSVSAVHEKQLSYMLGTVSSRPAVVVRPPYAWDEYGTVTVIPALTYAKPNITFTMLDKYGHNSSKCDYPFVPHTAHTVPISRLSRYIGRLENDELDELLYAYHWIHSPDPLKYGKIPECYKEVFENHKKYEMSPSPNTINTSLYVDNNMHLTSDTNFEMDLDLDLQHCTKPDVAQTFAKCPELHVKDSVRLPMVLPKVAPSCNTEETTKRAITKSEELPKVDIEAPAATTSDVRRPASTFTNDVLDRCAYAFRVPERIMNGTAKPRSTAVIREHGLVDKLREQYDLSDMEEAMDYYDRLTPFDQDFIMLRVSRSILCEITGKSEPVVILAKRIAGFLRDLELNGNMNHSFLSTTNSETPDVATDQLSSAEKSETSPLPVTELTNAELEQLRPYMKEKLILNIPDHLIDTFMRAPVHKLKAMYGGKQFKTKYAKAYSYCRMRRDVANK